MVMIWVGHFQTISVQKNSWVKRASRSWASTVRKSIVVLSAARRIWIVFLTPSSGRGPLCDVARWNNELSDCNKLNLFLQTRLCQAFQQFLTDYLEVSENIAIDAMMYMNVSRFGENWNIMFDANATLGKRRCFRCSSLARCGLDIPID